MPIARVTDVDPSKRTADAIIQGSGGTIPVTDLKLTDKCSPEVDEFILLFYDGVEYYGIDTIKPETPAAVEERQEQELVPGDEVLGDIDETHIAIRKGGLISLMVDMVTGIVMSKVNGIIQFMGKAFSFDTTFFHGRIKTNEDKKNTSAEVSLFGSPMGVPVSWEMLKGIFDTLAAKCEVDLAGMKDIDINLNIAPQTGVVVGPNLNVNWSTPQGKVKFKINGVTGVVEVESPTIIKVDAQTLLLNSNGSPLDRVLTAKDLCIYSGNMHGQGSGKVYVGK